MGQKLFSPTIDSVDSLVPCGVHLVCLEDFKGKVAHKVGVNCPETQADNQERRRPPDDPVAQEQPAGVDGPPFQELGELQEGVEPLARGGEDTPFAIQDFETHSGGGTRFHTCMVCTILAAYAARVVGRGIIAEAENTRK